MQATYSARRSPVSAIAALFVVLAALFLGATGGYLVKGLDHQSVAGSRPAITILAPAPAVQDSRVPARQSTRSVKNAD
jgi:hypothetical protein